MNEYVLDFAEEWAPDVVDERELEQFYAETAPAGAPGLADVREHVIAAFVRTRSPQLIAASPPIELELLARLDEFLPVKPSELVGSRFWSATEAVAHLAKARATVDAIADEGLRAALDAQLLAACDAIASAGAPVRFLERSAPREVSFDEQAAALASVGVVPRAGRTRADFLRNYSEPEIAAVPWYRLGDLFELSDGLVLFAARSIEHAGEDDANYNQLVTKLAALAQLPITNVQGTVDFGQRSAWVSFDLAGKTHRMEPDFGEYVDDRVFRWIAGFLPADRALYRLDYNPEHDAGDHLVICTDRAGYQRLRAAGAPFSPVVA